MDEFSWVFLAGFLLFGLLFGSFLNVVIYRLPLMLERAWTIQARVQLDMSVPDEESKLFTLAYPPSHCPVCKAEIKPWSNIPILSFLLQKGRCAGCHTPISWQYPLVELLTGLLFVAVYWKFGWSLQALGGVLFVLFIVPMIFIDAKTQLLPDILTLPFLWLGLLFNIPENSFVTLPTAVWGAVIGYMSLWIIFQVFKLFTGKEGMGFGDFKLLAALGAWFGAISLPVIALMASVIGLIFAVIMKVGKGQPMPFGPCLAIAGWVMLMFYEPVMQTFFTLINGQ